MRDRWETEIPLNLFRMIIDKGIFINAYLEDFNKINFTKYEYCTWKDVLRFFILIITNSTKFHMIQITFNTDNSF
jgi:hypothetical protein